MYDQESNDSMFQEKFENLMLEGKFEMLMLDKFRKPNCMTKTATMKCSKEIRKFNA